MMKSVSGITTATLLSVGAVLIAPVAATHIGGSTELQRLLAQHPNLKVGQVSFAPLSGTATLRNLTASFARRRVTIGILRLPFPRAAGVVSSALAATSQTAIADNVVIADGPVTYRIRHIELADSSLSTADLAALLDPTTEGTLEQRLRKLNASSILVSELSADSVVGAVEQHWTQKHIVLASVVAGKAAVASSAAGTFAVKDAQNATNGEMGSIALTGLDLGQIAHVLTADRTDDGEKLQPMYDSLLAKAIKLTDSANTQSVTIGVIKETGVKGRAFVGGLRAVSTKIANARPGDPASAAFLEDALHSFEVSQVELDDVAFVPRRGGNIPQSVTGFALARFAMLDVGEGKIGRVELSGLHVAGGFGTVSVASASLNDFKMPSTYFAPGSPEVSRVPSMGDAQLGGAQIDAITFEGSPSNGNSHGRIGVRVTHVGYSAPGFVVGEVPARANVTVDHIVFDVSPDSTALPVLAAMGYKKLDISSRVDTAYEMATKALAIDKFSISAPGVGSLDLKVALANVTRDVASRDPTIQAAAVESVLLLGADFFVNNGGVVDKAIALKATIDGLTIDQERDSLAALAAVQLPVLAGNAPQAVTLGKAVAAFIKSPQTLHVTLASPNGLGIADLQSIGDPGAFLSTLDVKATANQ